MGSVKNLTIMALLIGISFVMSTASADHDSDHEYDFRVSDDPGDEMSVDPEASIELKV